MNQHATPALGRALRGVAFLCVFLFAHHAAQASAVTDRLGLVSVFMLSNSDSGKCVSKSGGANLGQQFHGWRCNTKSPLQKFTLLERERDLYLIRTETGHLCLDVSGSAIKNGAPVVQWGCNGNANQLWEVIPDGGSNRFLLRARHSGRCLNLDHPGEKISTFVQRDCARGNKAQTFQTVK
jgi:hypothetical protein